MDRMRFTSGGRTQADTSRSTALTSSTAAYGTVLTAARRVFPDSIAA